MNSIEVYKSELSRWYSSTPTLLASVAEEEEGKEEGGGVKSAGEEGSEIEGKVEEEETENQAPIEVMFKFKGFNDTTLLYSYLSLSVSPSLPLSSLSPQLSSLAQLGEQAYSSVSNGEPVDDATIVDIIVHELK